MECPSCPQENAEGSHFCISCGSALLTPEAGVSSAPDEGSADTLPGDLQALLEELRRLRGDFVRLNDRLVTLERMQGITVSPLRPTPASRPAGQVSAHARVPPSPPREGVFDKVKEWDWEQILGGNWLARVGVLALIIGVAFFLKLAFDNDWIGPTGRVVLGIFGRPGDAGGRRVLAKAVSTRTPRPSAEEVLPSSTSLSSLPLPSTTSSR